MNQTKKIGRTGLIALIVSSCIGTGIFGITSDVARAAAPGPALLSWIIVGIGILLLVLSLNNLAQKRPDLDAGIFSYAQAGYGPFGEFISGWSYWLSAWLGNIAFATMLMSAVGTFWPVFHGGQNLPAILAAIACCWGLTLLVAHGVESAAIINTIGTIFKIVPLALFILLVSLAFKSGLFTADFWGQVTSNANGSAMPVAKQMQLALMTMIWVFIGVEGASVMSNRAQTPKAAQQAAVIGFVLLAVIYALVSLLPYGTLTRQQLANTGQPAIGYVLQKLYGNWGGQLINLGLIVSTLISWLSWTMLPAETLMLLAKDHVMPKMYARPNQYKAPAAALYVTAILQTIFLFSLLLTDAAYEFAYTLCTAAILFSYLLVGLYQIQYSWHKREWNQLIIGVLAAAFQLACMVIAGWQKVLLVSLSFIPGMLVYWYARHQMKQQLNGHEIVVMVVIVIISIITLGLLAVGTIPIQ